MLRLPFFLFLGPAQQENLLLCNTDLCLFERQLSVHQYNHVLFMNKFHLNILLVLYLAEKTDTIIQNRASLKAGSE